MAKNINETFDDRPLVSVLICTYNRVDDLKKCLDSMLDQTYDNFEVIVINGPSTDETENLLKKYPFKCLGQKKKGGLSEARNLGVREAKGEIVAFIDDDAVADKNWVKSHAMKYKDEMVGGVGGTIIMKNSKIAEYENRVNKFGVLKNEKKIANYRYEWFNTTCGCNTSFRKKILDEIGGFDGYYTFWFDETDVCVRMAKAGYKIESESRAVVQHNYTDGPERSNIWYHITQKQLYFIFKNFGDELPLEKILYENFKCYIYDSSYITLRFLLLRVHPIIYIKSLKYMITGRIQGFKDGKKFLRDKKKSSEPMA